MCCRWANGLYIVHLAVKLQAYHLPQSAVAAVNADAASAAVHQQADQRSLQSSNPLAQLLQGTHQLLGSDDNFTSLLEKAFVLCLESCLVPGSWDELVRPCLEAVLTFETPNILAQLGDNAIGPDVFLLYAEAYLWALGNAADVGKLQSIQQALKRKNARRANSQSDGLQVLSATVPAAMQMAIQRQLALLEPQVAALLVAAARNREAIKQTTAPASDAAPAAGPQAALQQSGSAGKSNPDSDMLNPIAALDGAQASQRAGQQSGIPAQSVQTHQLDTNMPDVATEQVAATPTISANAEAEGPAAPAAAADTAPKQLLSSAFDLLKSCYMSWKAALSSDPAQPSPIDKPKADNLLQR